MVDESDVTKTTASSLRLIELVKNPLAFLVLGLLIVDGTVATLAVTLEDFRGPLVWTIIGSVPGFILLVSAMAVWKPESLKGDRPLDKLYGRQFASDLFIALDGSLQNLEPADRVEAWATVADVITNDSASDAPYKQFCAEVAAHLRRMAQIPNRARGHGPIE